MSKRAEQLANEAFRTRSEKSLNPEFKDLHKRVVVAITTAMQAVRRRDAEICGEQKPGATGGVLTATYYELGVKHCAAAITKEPMP